MRRRLRSQLPKLSTAKLWGTQRCLSLQTVVCQGEDLFDPFVNQTVCSSCGAKVYVNKLFEGAAMKVCVKCSPIYQREMGEKAGNNASR
jgi:hypothetical protein